MEIDERLATGLEADQIVEEEIKKDVKYKRIDSESGYLTDEVEIENFKIYQKRDIMTNYMLGDYNEKGDYVLNSQLLKGLVSISKVKTGDYNEAVFLSSVSAFPPKGKLKFSLTISKSKEEEGVKIAVLKLLEPVKKVGGYIENTNSFIVASYKDKDDDAFIGKVNKIFHIGTGESGDVEQDDPAIVAIIMQRLKYLQDYASVYELDIAEIEKAYYYARLELLKDPKYEALLAEFKKHLTKGSMFIDPNSPLYFAYLNELMDIAIGIVGNKFPELGQQIKADLKPLMQHHNEQMIERDGNIMAKMQNMELGASAAATATTAAVLGKAPSRSKGANKSFSASKGGSQSFKKPQPTKDAGGKGADKKSGNSTLYGGTQKAGDSQENSAMDEDLKKALEKEGRLQEELARDYEEKKAAEKGMMGSKVSDMAENVNYAGGNSRPNTFEPELEL